ncbi:MULTISPECIES: WhiB family transcriptional regulator [unclassified Mycobacterium]|uniref:WhiB family transcriptional regulator n=1 Tax=unclassified Mycobacterium TaxID=2642494 RepID=UPI00178944CC|nr:WhiB family transcriptional regulator [Mycobacterium sp. OAS707]
MTTQLPSARGVNTTAEARDWQLSARCRGEDTDAFFHPEGERGGERRRRQRRAKAMCAECPVRHQCLVHAMKVPEAYGVWGGTSEDERARWLRTPSPVVC